MKNGIDLLNTGLIIISLVLAIIFPFELFLLVYAVLGPIHYLTEINWIRDKAYFVKSKNWVYIASLLAILVTLPVIFNVPFFSTFENGMLNFLNEDFAGITNAFIFIALVMAFAFLFIPNRKMQWLIVVLALLIAIIAKNLTVYNIWIGIFLPTILHVYLFTILFMWYGNLKTKSRIGYFNVVFMALIPFVIIVLSIDITRYEFSLYVKDVIIDNRFHVLNVNIAKFLGLSDGTNFFFNARIDLKIQIMIAFAYTYHYLNWFSKTTIIGWHKKLTSRKSLIIVVFWIISLGLYYYDYKVGLSLLLMLSLIHVFLEFPLNFISIKGIYNHMVK